MATKKTDPEYLRDYLTAILDTSTSDAVKNWLTTATRMIIALSANKAVPAAAKTKPKK